MWLDSASNHLVYETSKVPEVLKIVPGAKSLYNGYVAAPITLHNLQLLRYLGLPVIPPMRDYDWPIYPGWRPREHQMLMANFMVLHPRCFNLSDMGTMKTLAALWAADFIMRENPGWKTLIVAPLSTLQRVWIDAIFQNFLGRRTGVVIHGSADKREELLRSDHDFYVINYDGLGIGAPVQTRSDTRSVYRAIQEREDIKIVLVDECSAYKDATTRRHKVARKLIGTRDYVWLMSGTPTANGPLDAYGQAKLVNNAWGETYTGYKFRIMYRLNQFKWLPKVGANTEARKLLSPAIRFSIEDCVDLPPCTTQLRDVELSPDQAKAYKELKKELRLIVANGKVITAVNEGVLRWKLLQIACGAIYGVDHEVHPVDAAPRITALREVISQCSEKIIIFAPLTSVVRLLYKELKEFSREVVNGEVSHKARSDIFQRFQEQESPRILIADPGTMAHGLTLTAASTIIWFAPTDKTEIYLQANKRIDRPGQTKHTTIVQIASTDIEREIYRRLERNESMQGLILKMVREGPG